MGLGVWGLGFEVWGFGVWGFGLGVWGLRFGGLGFGAMSMWGARFTSDSGCCLRDRGRSRHTSERSKRTGRALGKAKFWAEGLIEVV